MRAQNSSFFDRPGRNSSQIRLQELTSLVSSQVVRKKQQLLGELANGGAYQAYLAFEQSLITLRQTVVGMQAQDPKTLADVNLVLDQTVQVLRSSPSEANHSALLSDFAHLASRIDGNRSLGLIVLGSTLQALGWALFVMGLIFAPFPVCLPILMSSLICLVVSPCLLELGRERSPLNQAVFDVATNAQACAVFDRLYADVFAAGEAENDGNEELDPLDNSLHA